ncbi:MAG TPA: ATP-binding protein [Flavihumibacter sp.]|jgi:PAS domain S-box-containing protein
MNPANILSGIVRYWENLAEDLYHRQENLPATPLKTLTEVGMAVAGLNMILCTVMKEYMAAFACLVVCSLLFLSYFLRLYNRVELAKWVVIFSFNAGVLVVSYFVGIKSGVYLYYFPVIFAMIFLIDTKISKDLIIAEIATLTFFGIAFIISPNNGSGNLVQQSHYIYNLRINLTLSLLLTGLVAFSILKALNKKEEDIRGEKNLGDTIFNTSLDAIFIVDLDTQLFSNCNRRALELFKWSSRDAVIGKSVESLLGEESDMRIRTFSREPWQSHSPWSGNMEFSDAEGSPIFAYVNFVAFEHQKIKYVKMSILDITEVKIAEVETLKAKERAERAARVKSRFLSNMSHELRTPLNAIIGTTNLLHQEYHLNSQRQMLDVLKHSSEHMLTLVNDILDYSKLEADKMDLKKEPFNLPSFLERVISVFENPARQKCLELKADVASIYGIDIISDELRLQQVLNNLLSNAIKFTDEGEVKLGVKVLMRRSNNVTLRFSVSDTGIGIPKDKQPRIFDKFYQADLETTRKYGGSGLGLAISHYIVQKMGGDLIVESEPGKGSTFSFTVTLPLQTERQSYIEEVPVYRNDDLTGVNVLVAEDNPINMMVVKRFLAKWNANIIEAVNGVEAVSLYAEHRPDILLVDLEMPELDGAGVVAHIRKTEKEIPIIAFTAAVYDHMQADLIDKGFNDFIPKPFRPEDLKQKLLQYARNLQHV